LIFVQMPECYVGRIRWEDIDRDRMLTTNSNLAFRTVRFHAPANMEMPHHDKGESFEARVQYLLQVGIESADRADDIRLLFVDFTDWDRRQTSRRWIGKGKYMEAGMVTYIRQRQNMPGVIDDIINSTNIPDDANLEGLQKRMRCFKTTSSVMIAGNNDSVHGWTSGVEARQSPVEKCLSLTGRVLTVKDVASDQENVNLSFANDPYKVFEYSRVLKLT
jgi:hypothetical protein